MIGSLSSLVLMQCHRFKHKVHPELKDVDAFLNYYNALPNYDSYKYEPVVKCKTIYCRFTVGFQPFLDLCMWTFL